MAEKPDFVVDPYGNVQDVRQPKHSRPSEATPVNESRRGSSEHGSTAQADAHPTQKSTSIPGGVVIIPVGLILTLFLIIVTAIWRASLPPTSDHRYSNAAISDLNSGNRAFANGDYSAALARFNQAIDAEPDFGKAYNSRGIVYQAQGDYDQAIRDFDKAIELLPDWPGVYNNRGAAYLAIGEYGQAVADLDRAIQLNSTFAKAYLNRGVVYQTKGDYQLAIADFGKAIEFTPESSSTIDSPGSDNSTPGPGQEFIEGLDNLMQLTQSKADLPLAYANRGLAYFNIGDVDQAISDLEKALNLGLEPIDQQWVEVLLANLR